ncbi:MAG: O-methyltransferase [Acidimicrobiales bacterium]
MTEIVDPKIEAYAEECTSAPPEYLVSLAAETSESMESPQMMVGPVEGKFLEMLVFATRATRVLEIGTFTGYSALAMAAALPPSGHIITCELDPRHAEIARRHIALSPFADMIEVKEGPALETIAGLSGAFDLIFIDADKASYREYFELSLDKVSGRGLIVADNTLRGGGVIDRADKSKETAAIRSFNKGVVTDTRVTCVQLTVRDGITIIRRR